MCSCFRNVDLPICDEHTHTYTQAQTQAQAQAPTRTRTRTGAHTLVTDVYGKRDTENGMHEHCDLDIAIEQGTGRKVSHPLPKTGAETGTKMGVEYHMQYRNELRIQFDMALAALLKEIKQYLQVLTNQLRACMQVKCV